MPHLRWRLARLRARGRAGIPALDALVDGAPPGMSRAESWLEAEGLRRIAEAGLPLPRCQVRFRASSGRRGRVDLFWDDVKLVAELNGHATHATRRDAQDAAERAAALGLDGWRVVTFVYQDVTERSDYVVATIRAHLAELERRQRRSA